MERAVAHEHPTGPLARLSLEVDRRAKLYHGKLETEGLSLDRDTVYRLRIVSAGGLTLGHADV